VAGLSISEFLRLIQDLAEIGVTVLLIYVVYKIAMLIGTLEKKVKGEKSN